MNVRWLGPAAALVLLAGALAEIVLTTGWYGPKALAIGCALVICVPFAALPRMPLAVVTLSCSGLIIEALVVRSPASSAALAAVLLAGFVAGLAEQRGRWAGLVVVTGTAIVAIVRVPGNQGPPSLAAFIFAVALYVSPFVLGSVVRARSRTARAAGAAAQAAEEEQRLIAELAVRDERDRIANELQVVVTGSVADIQAAADRGASLIPHDLGSAADAFTAIEHTGQHALGEMRRLLGVLREVDDAAPLSPQPRLADLDRLTESFAALGTRIQVVVGGTARPLADGVELAAYRILEGALRIYGPCDVALEIIYLERALRLRATGGAFDTEVDSVVLTGMRERAALCGGSVMIELADGKEVRVDALLPIDAP
jgi:signal transduction histidine kinase